MKTNAVKKSTTTEKKPMLVDCTVRVDILDRTNAHLGELIRVCGLGVGSDLGKNVSAPKTRKRNLPVKRDLEILCHTHRIEMTTPQALHPMFFSKKASDSGPGA